MLALFIFLREISQLAISSEHNHKATNLDRRLQYHSILHIMERAIRWRILIFTQRELSVFSIYSLCNSTHWLSILCYLKFNSSHLLFPSKQFNLLADGEAEKGKRDLLLLFFAPACFHLQGILFHAYSHSYFHWWSHQHQKIISMQRNPKRREAQKWNQFLCWVLLPENY